MCNRQAMKIRLSFRLIVIKRCSSCGAKADEKCSLNNGLDRTYKHAVRPSLAEIKLAKCSSCLSAISIEEKVVSDWRLYRCFAPPQRV
jgi:hypothetical protein